MPIRDYEGYEPYISQVREGRFDALFGSDAHVLMFAKTSGTTARPKTIPVTRESLKDYREGWTIWGILAFDHHPEIIRWGLKPILQMASDWRESTTSAGIPCGAITGLTSHMQNPLIRLTYCMPPPTMRIRDIESKYYIALRLSVYRDVGATIAANPSTILAIARLGDREKQTLIRDVANGTVDPRWDVPSEVREALRFRSRWKRKSAARRLEAIVDRTGRLLPKDYWPGMDFLANWTGGTMGAYLRQFPEYFGVKPVRDVGLIASEGRMTIPISDGTPAGLLDYTHSYFEFIPEEQVDADNPDVVEAVDLVEGRRYFILLTTAGGLYRYQIHDLVLCSGFEGQAPLLEFLNKGAALLEHDRREAIGIPGCGRREPGAADRQDADLGVSPLADLGRPPLLHTSGREIGPEGQGRSQSPRGRGRVPTGPHKPRVRKPPHNPPTRPNPPPRTTRGGLA